MPRARTLTVLRRTALRAALVACALVGVPPTRVPAATVEARAIAEGAPGNDKPASRRKRSTSRARRPAVRRVARRRAPPPPPLIPTAPFGVASLDRDLGTLLDARVKRGTWGVLVTSASRGDTLFSRNADLPLMPASTQKLFTTVLAFERLGVHHQLLTEVLRDGTVGPDGTLRGTLVLRGGGDPALSGRFLGGTPEAPMRALAQIVANAGIRRIEGDLLGDAGAFESRLVPDGWLERYRDASYAARVSALSLNANLLHVAITPGQGSRAQVTLRPALSGFKVVNNTQVRSRGAGARLTVGRKPDGTIVVAGWMGRGSPVRVYTVVVDDPARYATAAFAKALEEAGVELTGSVRLDAAPRTAVPVGGISSPPLWQLAKVMNGESDNHFAELLLRDATRGQNPVPGLTGSARLGNEQLRSLLAERAGTSPSGISIADGSGLSSRNRVTPRALAELLMYANRAPWSREFHETLPVAGVSETLRSRMVATPAQGNLHAKTGTTNDVIALGGYVTSRSGELLTFSVFYNGRERWNARQTIDAMGATMAGFAR